MSPAGNQRGAATVAVIETADAAPPPIQIVLSTDVSPPTEHDVPGSSASIRVQHLEAMQPSHSSDLDPHVSERRESRAAATMPQLQPSSSLPTATSSTSTSSTILLLTTVLRRVRTQKPIFYFYESNDSDTDGSDCDGEEHDKVAVRNRKRRRGEIEGSPRRLAYTTPRKHAARLSSKGTLRAIALASSVNARGTNHNKQRVALTRGPRTPQPQPTSPNSPTVPKGYGVTSGRNAGSPRYSPTAQREQLPFDPPSPTVRTSPVQHGRAGGAASSGSASGPHIAVRRSNMENVVMPRPAAGRQSKNTSISSLIPPPPVPSKSVPDSGITSINTAAPAASARLSSEQVAPSSPISLKRPGSHTLKRSEGSAASFSPPSPVVETTLRISTSGGSSNSKPSDNSQTITHQHKPSGVFPQAGEGGKGVSAPVSPAAAPAEGRLRALFKRKSKHALAQRQQRTEPPSVEQLKLPELVRYVQDDKYATWH